MNTPNTQLGGGGFVKPGSSINQNSPGYQPNINGPSNTHVLNNYLGSNSGGLGMSNSGFGNTGQSSSGSSLLKVAGAGAGGGLLGGVLGKKVSGSGGLGSSSGGFGSSSGGFGSSSGGFGSSSSGFGNTGKKSSGSNILKMAGAGVGGGLLGGALSKGFKKNPYGVNQYSGYKKPKQSKFGKLTGLFGGKKKSYGYKEPGYGTNWGTNFAGGVGQYKKPKKGISKKALGLGIGAGFLGGAALGVAGTMATYSVYHKYQEFKRMMYMNQMGGMGGMGMGNPGMGMGMGNQGMGMGMGSGMGMGMMAGGWDNDYYTVSEVK